MKLKFFILKYSPQVEMVSPLEDEELDDDDDELDVDEELLE